VQETTFWEKLTGTGSSLLDTGYFLALDNTAGHLITDPATLAAVVRVRAYCVPALAHSRAATRHLTAAVSSLHDHATTAGTGRAGTIVAALAAAAAGDRSTAAALHAQAAGDLAAVTVALTVHGLDPDAAAVLAGRVVATVVCPNLARRAACAAAGTGEPRWWLVDVLLRALPGGDERRVLAAAEALIARHRQQPWTPAELDVAVTLIRDGHTPGDVVDAAGTVMLH
jgi:hypothetical protein